MPIKRAQMMPRKNPRGKWNVLPVQKTDKLPRRFSLVLANM